MVVGEGKGGKVSDDIRSGDIQYVLGKISAKVSATGATTRPLLAVLVEFFLE